MTERDHNEAENENESRFQRFFLSTMKSGALPQAKAKETAPLARQTRRRLVPISSSRNLRGSQSDVNLRRERPMNGTFGRDLHQFRVLFWSQ
jgi:hypothetical protein